MADGDDDGTTTAILDTEVASRFQLWAGNHRRGGGWSTPRLVASGPAEDLGLVTAEFAVGPDGSAVLAYSDELGRMWGVCRNAQGAWSPPKQFPGPEAGAFPAVTAGGEGVVSVTYLDIRHHLRLVQGSRRQWEEPVTLPVTLHGADASYATSAGRPGEITVAWWAPGRPVMVGRFSDGQLSKRTSLSGRVRSLADLQVVASADGSATIAWQAGSFDPPSGPVFALHQEPDSTVHGRVTLAPAGIFELRGDRQGNAFIAGIPPNATGGVPTAYFDNETNSWTPPKDIAEGAKVDPFSAPALAMSRRGDTLAAWVSPPAGNEAHSHLDARRSLPEK